MSIPENSPTLKRSTVPEGITRYPRCIYENPIEIRDSETRNKECLLERRKSNEDIKSKIVTIPEVTKEGTQVRSPRAPPPSPESPFHLPHNDEELKKIGLSIPTLTRNI